MKQRKELNNCMHIRKVLFTCFTNTITPNLIQFISLFNNILKQASKYSVGQNKGRITIQNFSFSVFPFFFFFFSFFSFHNKAVFFSKNTAIKQNSSGLNMSTFTPTHRITSFNPINNPFKLPISSLFLTIKLQFFLVPLYHQLKLCKLNSFRDFRGI